MQYIAENRVNFEACFGEALVKRISLTAHYLTSIIFKAPKLTYSGPLL
jgi:hypothetical protein